MHCLGFWVCFIFTAIISHKDHVHSYLFILVWARAAGMFNAVEYIAEGGNQVVAWCSGNIVGFHLC